MKIDEANWHDLKDKLHILKKRVSKVGGERKDMITLLNLFLREPTNTALRQAAREFLHDIGELKET